jgi:hypothetical protein
MKGEIKRIFFGCLLAGVGLFLAPGLLGQGQQGQNLTWDIQMQREGIWQAVSPTVRVEVGQSFRVAITPFSDCFCYVLSQDAEQKITVLHDQPVRDHDEIFIEALKADNMQGGQTLYVIMSLVRQARLEGFIGAYTKTTNSRNANNLLGEIANLQDSVSKLGEPRSDIIQSGGATRGQTSSQENLTRFSEKNMYVRTIRILAAQPAQ